MNIIKALSKLLIIITLNGCWAWCLMAEHSPGDCDECMRWYQKRQGLEVCKNEKNEQPKH